MPFWNLHFFLGEWMSEKNYPAHHHFPTPPKFGTIPKGCETHGFLGVVFGDASFHRTDWRTSMNRLMASKKLIMASKWASSRLQSTMECRRDNHATCWQRTHGMSYWAIQLVLHGIFYIYTRNFLPSIIVQRGRWRASASLLLGDYICVCIYDGGLRPPSPPNGLGPKPTF